MTGTINNTDPIDPTNREHFAISVEQLRRMGMNTEQIASQFNIHVDIITAFSNASDALTRAILASDTNDFDQA